MDRPTKTFELREPMDVLIKIKFDLERLKAGRGSKELQFAAIDCAVWLYHLIDWVLEAVGDEAHLRLTGVPRGAPGATRGFLRVNADRLPHLAFCQQIANATKHRVLRRSSDDPTFVAGHTVVFDPPFDASNPVTSEVLRGRAMVFLKDTRTKERFEAYDIFLKSYHLWAKFLDEEKLFIYGYDGDIA